MKQAQLLIGALLMTGLNVVAQSVSLEQAIERPEHYFKPHPSHKVPKDMVIQHFKVNFKAKTKGFKAGEKLDYKYELIEKSGQPKTQQQGSSFNLIADEFGRNKIKLTVSNKLGQKASAEAEVFVHFSQQHVAGGNTDNLDPAQVDPESFDFVCGKIEDDKLIYKGLRYFPQIREGLDKNHESGKHGFYLTKEPRLLITKKGTMVIHYHAAVKERNDAAAGMGVMSMRSTDGGRTWTDERAVYHHANAVAGWTGAIEYNGEIQLYFAGGHRANKKHDEIIGVYKSVSKDEGKTWSDPVHQPELTALLNGGKANEIGASYFPAANGLTIENMEWKGQKGTAIIMPFYVGVKFVISMDGGKTWDVFFDPKKHKVVTAEMSMTLLEDRRLYVVTRVQWVKEATHKYEYYLNLKGELLEYPEGRRKNHVRTKCHHGARRISSGPWKGRIAFLSHFNSVRENGTIAVSDTPRAEKFDTRWLSYGGGFGYADIGWLEEEQAFYCVAECEPMDSKTHNFYGLKKKYAATCDNERFSLQGFKFSIDYWKSLPKAK